MTKVYLIVHCSYKLNFSLYTHRCYSYLKIYKKSVVLLNRSLGRLDISIVPNKVKMVLLLKEIDTLLNMHKSCSPLLIFTSWYKSLAFTTLHEHKHITTAISNLINSDRVLLVVVVVQESFPVGLMSGTDLISHTDIGLSLLSQLGHLSGHPPQLL